MAISGVFFNMALSLHTTNGFLQSNWLESSIKDFNSIDRPANHFINMPNHTPTYVAFDAILNGYSRLPSTKLSPTFELFPSYIASNVTIDDYLKLSSTVVSQGCCFYATIDGYSTLSFLRLIPIYVASNTTIDGYSIPPPKCLTLFASL